MVTLLKRLSGPLRAATLTEEGDREAVVADIAVEGTLELLDSVLKATIVGSCWERWLSWSLFICKVVQVYDLVMY